MRIARVTITAVTALGLVGCSAGRVVSHRSFQVPNGAICMYTSFTANLYGPGLRRVDLHCDSDPTNIGSSYAVGPDAGVAIGTAWLQGAGIAGGAAVLGASFPKPKGSNTTVTSGNASATTDSHAVLAQDDFTTAVGTYNAVGGPPSVGGGR